MNSQDEEREFGSGNLRAVDDEEYHRCLCGQMIHIDRTECIECERDGYVCPNCGVDKQGFVLEIKRLQQSDSENTLWQETMVLKIKDMETKLAKLTYMAKCFIHSDKTCSLQAQGYSEIECAELATEDSMATEMLAIINGFESRYDKADIKELEKASLVNNRQQ